jgi:hypothetical protein
LQVSVEAYKHPAPVLVHLLKHKRLTKVGLAVSVDQDSVVVVSEHRVPRPEHLPKHKI